MKRIENIKIDVKNKQYDEIKLKQMDTTQLVFNMYDNSREIVLTDITADVVFTKPNGRIVVQNAVVDELEKTVTVDLLPDCVRDYGRGSIEVELKQDNEILSSFQLDVKIEKTGKDNVNSDNASHYFEEIETNEAERVSNEIIRQSNELARQTFFDNLEERIENLESNTSPGNGNSNNTNDLLNLEEIIGIDVDTFSTSSTYAIDDIVVYNNKLYKCTTAVTVAGAWNISNWTNISIMDYQLLQDIKIRNSLSGGKSYYGICNTDADEQVKIVNCPEFVLEKGARISVRFHHGNTFRAYFDDDDFPSMLRLQMNNEEVAIDVVYAGGISSNAFHCESDEIITFIYNGAYWETDSKYLINNKIDQSSFVYDSTTETLSITI